MHKSHNLKLTKYSSSDKTPFCDGMLFLFSTKLVKMGKKKKEEVLNGTLDTTTLAPALLIYNINIGWLPLNTFKV